MFPPNLLDSIVAILPIVLAYLAGGATVFALVCTLVYRADQKDAKHVYRQPSQMDVEADQEAIAQALGVMVT